MKEILSDAQVEANDVFADLAHPTADPLRTVNNPLEFDRVEKRKPAPPPEVGQHTEEVLRESGYEDDSIDRRVEQKVVSMPGR